MDLRSEVDREKGYKGCCDVVNRGVALWKGKVFVGAYDGRLIALDAETGKVVWGTPLDRRSPYTITGAPRMVKGKVIIGNGGADTACAAMSPPMTRRPASRSGGSSPCPAIRQSRSSTLDGGRGKTWDRPAMVEQRRRRHARGTASPSIPNWTSSISAPATARRGTGIRSPPAATISISSSIVALNADTGKYIWHYQETPGDTWDYKRPSR